MTAVDQPARVASRWPGARLLIGAQLLVLACYAAVLAALMFLAIREPGGWVETTPETLFNYGPLGYLLYVPMWIVVSAGFALDAVLTVFGIRLLTRMWRVGGPRWTLAFCTAATAMAGLVHITPLPEMIRVWMLG